MADDESNTALRPAPNRDEVDEKVLRRRETDRRRRARNRAAKLGTEGPPLLRITAPYRPRAKTPEEKAQRVLDRRERNRIASADYRRRHPERRKAIVKRWDDANKDKKREAEARRRATQEARDRRRDQKRLRYEQDTQFRLSEVLRATISAALRRKLSGLRKCAPTMRLIGCTIAELMAHLESRFQPGMTWDNYGFDGWHIDHVKPLASFNLGEPSEQERAFHWSNLQPLWWPENMSKGAKTSWEPRAACGKPPSIPRVTCIAERTERAKHIDAKSHEIVAAYTIWKQTVPEIAQDHRVSSDAVIRRLKRAIPDYEEIARSRKGGPGKKRARRLPPPPLSEAAD